MQQADFFARQDSARRHTKLLEVYLALAVFGTIALTCGTVAFFASVCGHNPLEPRFLIPAAVVTILIISGGSVYKIAQLSDGGSTVAEMLGGRPIIANTNDPEERKFLNVVEEMSIASGTPIPQAYVLCHQRGINAFAAGHTTKDAVICVTPAALKCLSRDELQGVVAHEFSHILNGDMALNLRLMGLVFGLLCLTIAGRVLLQTTGNIGQIVEDSTESRRGGIGNAGVLLLMILMGVALIVIGAIGVFFGKLIKSAVSRQREYLADASAVQFTRNPMGLANALKKVGSVGSRIDDANAEEASHLFFANGIADPFLTMFATHPPLQNRILALDPAWDGKFIKVDLSNIQLEEPDLPEGASINYTQRFGRKLPGTVRPAQIAPVITAATIVGAAGGSALHTPHSALSYAADWRSKLPPVLDAAAREPMSAVALIYALLLSRDTTMRATQLEQLKKQSTPGVCDETVKIFGSVADLESRVRLPLASLSMTALRLLSPGQFAEFEKNIRNIIESDQQLELFEYTLQKIVLRQLEPSFLPPKRPVVQYYALKPLVPDCAVLLSALAYAGQNEPAQIESAFRQGAMKLNVPDLALCPRSDYDLQKIDAALNRLNQTSAQIKNVLLNACAETVAADGVIEENEAELLRAIADTLDCPIPPFLHLEA